MVLKIFTQPNCPKCPTAKRLGKKIEKEGTAVENWDVTTVDGLAEASFYSVMTAPSLILADDQGGKIKSWQGKTPTLKEVKSLLV